MSAIMFSGRVKLGQWISRAFRPRHLYFHDGHCLRHARVSGFAQAAFGSGLVLMLGLSTLGASQVAGVAPLAALTIAHELDIVQMHRQVASMRAGVMKLKSEAARHAARIDQQQAMIAAVLTGDANAVLPASTGSASADARMLVAPLLSAEARQKLLAARVLALVDSRYRSATGALRQIGVDGGRLIGAPPAVGGPYEPMDADAAGKTVPDPTFRALFQSWKRLDGLKQGLVAIPSQKPVDVVTFTSGFGVRTDPFRGGAAMHAGVDIPGPIGTSVYATADGVVSRAEWASGYGNLVELNHGRGIQTRYGHLSAVLVQPGQRVRRGELIARMGSTGRSTGSHLHYEVRLDGAAVNPVPFLTTSNYLAALQAAPTTRVAIGGPAN